MGTNNAWDKVESHKTMIKITSKWIVSNGITSIGTKLQMVTKNGMTWNRITLNLITLKWNFPIK